MIYWLFYHGGVGGDGFANLLEFANDITALDGNKKWRYQEKRQGKIKFNKIPWVEPDEWFRLPLAETAILNPVLKNYFLERIENNDNIILPAHYRFYEKYWDQFKHKHLFKQTCKIWLYTTNYKRAAEDLVDKEDCISEDKRNSVIYQYEYMRHLKSWDDTIIPVGSIRHENFDLFIDIEQAWEDWNYLDKKLKLINIELDKTYYEQYLDISKRRKSK